MSSDGAERAEIARLKARVADLERQLTEASQTGKALEASEERFRLAFETSPDAVAITRIADGKLLMANEGFSAITGWDRAHALGRSTQELSLWKHAADRDRMISMLRDKGIVRNFEAEYLRKDGSSSWALFSARPIAVGGEACLLTTVRDVGALRVARTEREEMHQRLFDAEKLEAVARIASGVAHDFNNMLTVIRTVVALLRQPLPTDTQTKYLDQIDGAAAGAAGLTGRLLAVARRQVLSPRVFRLDQLIADMTPMIRTLLPESIDLEVTGKPARGSIYADPGQLERAILNLVLNARDAMPTSGKLSLRLSNEPGGDAPLPRGKRQETVNLEIQDTGTGIPRGVQMQVFEPFFTTKGDDGGSGLGLAVVDGIVHQSGGTIKLKSNVGVGTTFTLCFPHSDMAPETPAGPELAHAPVRTGTHLLLVEDDETLRKVLQLTLERAGYRVTLAADGGEAISAAEMFTDHPAAMITDMIMPKLNGPETARLLRERWPDLKVLFISGYAGDQLLADIPSSSNSLFLHKVFTPRQLLQALDQLLARPE